MDYAPQPTSNDMDGPGAVPGPAPEPPDYSRGAPDTALLAAHTVVDQTFGIARKYHNLMELLSTIARWGGVQLTLWDKTQWVHGCARNVAAALSVPPVNVRVICRSSAARLHGNLGATQFSERGRHDVVGGSSFSALSESSSKSACGRVARGNRTPGLPRNRVYQSPVTQLLSSWSPKRSSRPRPHTRPAHTRTSPLTPARHQCRVLRIVPAYMRSVARGGYA